MQLHARLDRQLRIQGWNQRVLDEARLGVVGDEDLLASLFVLSAAALGVGRLIVIGPRVEPALVATARRLNPGFNLAWLDGYYAHPVLDDLFDGCDAIVDLSHYGLANKLLLQHGFHRGIPIVRGFCSEHDGAQGFRVFTYLQGREWQELEEVVAEGNLPGDHFDDGVLDIIVSGLALDETKNVLMGMEASEEVIAYTRRRLGTAGTGAKVCVVGAGALGNFVGLGLAYAGFRDITVMDPDVVEVTNLNRQVLAADGIGTGKADTLARKLNEWFGTDIQARMAYARRDTDLSGYDVVFDCVDNHETRIVLSEKCKQERKVLISGGTGPEAGQVIVFDPARGNATPAEVLGLYDIVKGRAVEAYQRETASCMYQPEPSVVMANQIVGGLMVEACRMVLAGVEAGNAFYDSRSHARIFL